MKKIFIISFLFFATVIFSQKKVVKNIETTSQEVEISTIGLDNFVLENSTSNFVEIILFAENPNEQHIFLNNESDVFKIEFKIEEIQEEETVFRKFITKRLQRASAIVKIPNGKKATIYGGNINIESKNYKGSLTIFSEKGIIKLNTIKANTAISLYVGSIYAILKNANINVTSNIGKIKIDDVLYQKTFKKKSEKR